MDPSSSILTTSCNLHAVTKRFLIVVNHDVLKTHADDIILPCSICFPNNTYQYIISITTKALQLASSRVLSARYGRHYLCEEIKTLSLIKLHCTTHYTKTTPPIKAGFTISYFEKIHSGIKYQTGLHCFNVLLCTCKTECFDGTGLDNSCCHK